MSQMASDEPSDFDDWGSYEVKEEKTVTKTSGVITKDDDEEGRI